MFLYEKNRYYNSYRFSYKFASILFLFFFTNHKQESASWSSDNEKYFCFLFIVSCALLQGHAKFNRLL